MKFVRLPLLLLCLLGTVKAQQSPKSVQHDLETNYHDKLFTLRGFYRTESVHFDSAGRLISKADAGLGPTDGEIHAASFYISGNQLTIVGDLPVVIYEANTGQVTYKNGFVKREVVLDVAQLADLAGLEEAMWKVFYRPGERPLPACSTERAEAFRQSALKTVNKEIKSPDVVKPEVPISVSDCFPNGETAPHLKFLPKQPNQRVTPPRAIHDPEPGFPEPARKERLSGNVVLRMIVDSYGRPSTIVVIRPLGHGFDESAARTVHTWRFEPARVDGQPVAVSLSIEVSFHLY